jgi:hypothetical protein
MNKLLYESDFSSDSLRWIKIREEKKLNTLTNEDTFSDEKVAALEKLQEEIINNKDAPLAYFFACDFLYKIYKMQKVILDSKDAKYAFLFAQNIKHCDIKALQKLVLNSKKTKYICKFACFVNTQDKSSLEEVIIKSKNVKYAHMYLKHVKNADVSKFKKIIINSKKPRYLYELARHLKEPQEIFEIQDLIIQLKSFTYMRLFAEKIKLANVDKIEQAVLDLGNTNEIAKFAKYVRKSRMRKFLIVA